MSKAERVQREAVSLWIEVFGEPPSPDLDGREMIEVLLRNLEPIAYSRLKSAEGARNLTWPRKPRS